MRSTLNLVVAAMILMGSASAHVVIADPQAVAGSTFRAAFKVGHGCEGNPTTSLAIEIPEGVVAVKPMPKAGWTVDLRREKLVKSYDLHGKTITEDVREVTWRGGPLADAHYDEFVMLFRAPETAGKYFFKVRQGCETGKFDWVEVPTQGQTRRDLRSPAAELNVVAKPVNVQHAH